MGVGLDFWGVAELAMRRLISFKPKKRRCVLPFPNGASMRVARRVCGELDPGIAKRAVVMTQPIVNFISSKKHS